jgi:hypothetical protein
MKTLQTQYNLIKEGKGNKQQFFKSVRHLFPDLVTPVNTYEDTVRILKNKGIITEGIGGVVTKGKTPDWHAIFKENITEAAKEAKAEEKETTKEVTDMATRGYDYKDEKNYDNVFGQEFLKGYYTEMKDPKNKDKHVEELRQIVAKNLAKDMNYYVKDGQFGIKGVGYTTEAPGLGTPKEAKGKHKSSGYSDLKESVLRSQIYLLVKEVLSESKFEVGDTVTYKGDKYKITRFIDDRIYIKSLKYSGRPDSWVKASDLKEALAEGENKDLLKHRLGVLKAALAIAKKDLTKVDKDGKAYKEVEKTIAGKKREIEALEKEILDEGIHDRDITSASHTNVKGKMGDYDPQARAANLASLANFGPKSEPKNTDEALGLGDEKEFDRITTFAEKLYDKTGSVGGALKALKQIDPKNYVRFKNEVEQHLTQKFEG